MSAPMSRGTLSSNLEMAFSNTTIESPKPLPLPNNSPKPPLWYNFSNQVVRGSHVIHVIHDTVDWMTTSLPMANKPIPSPTLLIMSECSRPRAICIGSLLTVCGIVGAKLRPPWYS